MVRTDSHVMASPGKHQFWTVNSAGESSGEMSPPLDIASPPKKQVWTVNQELARFGHRYSLEKREQERELMGDREGRRREEEEKKMSFNSSKPSAFVSGMVLQGTVCGSSVSERLERIFKSRFWNQHHGTLKL